MLTTAENDVALAESNGNGSGGSPTTVTVASIDEERKDSIDNDGSGSDGGSPTTVAVASIDEERKDSIDNDGTGTLSAMDLNVAYESLEVMRKLNLQVEFGERMDINQCTSCLREKPSPSPKHWIRRRNDAVKKATPCLGCGSPVCSQHASREFHKQNITVCHKCSHIFDPDLIATTIMSDEQKMVNYILDVYDRALLILKYSSRYIDETAVALEHNTKRNDKIGLGSSATGVVAGVVGVAAAATIWTPVGPPLLIASILFGSGATAAAAGSEAVNYRLEPNQMANRIITLYSLVTAITDSPAAMDDMGTETASREVGPSQRGSSSLHWARATLNGLKPLTLGTMSAISVVTEARETKKIVQKIRAGSPCEVAQELQRIKAALESLLDTTTVAAQLTKAIERHSLNEPEQAAG